MTESDQGRIPVNSEADVRARIDRAVGRARLNLLWEAVWPRLAPLAVLAVLFAAISWLGVWRLTSAPVRYGILAGFVVALGYYLIRLVRFAVPTRAAAFARVEQVTGAPHRPATSFADQMATGTGDPMAEALWMAHRRRLLAAMDRLRAGVPAPKLTHHDPVAVRFLVILLAVVGFFVAGDEKLDRIGEAFRGGESVAAAVARVDAWVTPPAYTGRPPIFLTGDAAKPAGTEYSVPTGSIVTVRTGGTHDLDVLAGEAKIAPTAAPSKVATADGAEPPLEHQVKLTAATNVAVKKGNREISAWRFSVVPDNPPSVSLVGEPKVAESGALHLTYALEDDYGVVAAFGELAPVDATVGGRDARPLYEAPKLPLSLPQLRTRKGQGETTRDLTAHPWAGAKVKLTLVARDEAGQEGRSAPTEITLPARGFANPLARAIVEQRGKLAMNANAQDNVADALDALTMEPDGHMASKDYLALRSAYFRLADARSDDELRGVVDYLWTIALGLEDQGASLAAQQLRAAQDALREALENNASDEEIARLTQELRDAMQKFLQALADQARQNPNVAQLPPNANMQELRAQDLDRLLDQIENLSKTGAKDAARQLLSQLQNMLENLQAGQPQQGDQGQQQAMQMLDQLGDMIRKQEDLMNQTFRAQRGQNPQGQEMSPEELEQALKNLQSGQQSLSDALQKLMEQMQGQGMDPSGKLGQAGESMGKAAQALGNGRPGSAVGEQGTALDALRQGAQGLAQQLANGNQGQGQYGRGMRGGNGDQTNNDPLGRPRRTTGADLGSTVKVPDEIDTQRAREILDAIRQRLGDAYRPEIERDYLERLLEPF
ncbi:MAG TPA: TIGR02302 family protein [Bauldia sp.]|nr:TIGR02302 family protein [Bauldia sp.]